MTGKLIDVSRLVGTAVKSEAPTLENIDCGMDGGATAAIKYEQIRLQTKGAVLFRLSDDDNDEVWVPKSLLSQVERDAFHVARWWARKEGLEER